MYENKVIAFVIALIFSMATVTGGVSAVNFSSGDGTPAVTTETSMNYPIVVTSDFTAENLTNKTKLSDERSKEPGDYHYKKQKQGIEKLKTISTSGIPPKKPGEIIMYNIPRLMSVMSTVKTKITYNFSKFYKKLK
ncbi:MULTISPECIES: hypothetical protein [Methanobacterium]|uniref:Uncharacterized protein n=1 Tax=Methanobacterium bryantii TaxID=2161 RepID=A0A2A2H788_METBR|nr:MULTISPECIES: hypothetical protein [Methanobacterium]OEC85117.1 hypothetical protein A9507_14400 [Methanobacterium sp. A39]PAV05267.1 hypothetical protein ASJ80_09975 [Methanobacterium bryantii]